MSGGEAYRVFKEEVHCFGREDLLRGRKLIPLQQANSDLSNQGQKVFELRGLQEQIIPSLLWGIVAGSTRGKLWYNM